MILQTSYLLKSYNLKPTSYKVILPHHQELILHCEFLRKTRSNKVIWGVHSRWWISSNVSTLYLVRGKIMVIWRKTRSYTSSKTPHITKQFSLGISYKVYDFDIQIYVWDMIEIIVSQVDFTIHLMLICILVYTMAPQSIFLNIFICWLHAGSKSYPANLISPKKLQPQTHLVQGNSTSSPGVDNIALRIFT